MPFKFAQAGGNKGLRCPLSLHKLVETKALKKSQTVTESVT